VLRLKVSSDFVLSCECVANVEMYDVDRVLAGDFLNVAECLYIEI